MLDQLVAAIILAAGASERMEQTKALLPIEGVPAIRFLIARIAEAGFAPIVTVTSTPVHGKLAALHLSGQVVINDETEKGPLHSFRLGLEALPGESIAALLTPVDHPLVRVDSLQKLRAAASASRVIVPRYQGRRGHPTLFGRDLWPLIFSLPLEEGARGVLHRHPETVVELDVDDPGVIQNLNAPSDLTSAGL
jgi:molybdenum cofactor cytidylyltransferase